MSPTSCSWASRAHCAPPACRSPRTAPRPILRAVAAVGARRMSTRPTGLGAQRSAPGTTTSGLRPGVLRLVPRRTDRAAGADAASGDGEPGATRRRPALGGLAEDEPLPDIRAAASDIEVLRHRDIAELSAPTGPGTRASSAPWSRVRRGGLPTGPDRGTAETSTRTRRCAAPCTTWANRASWPGVVAAHALAGSCCWSTCRDR